ncbi:MAG TPA: alcohol dehydrogenase catalytic domain-containing protein, partial [Acetobacteraceae bacterium]|nr:alcohol dehydrogenase catalytic domain-containing protein [Acetobacteraceae bacterium]
MQAWAVTEPATPLQQITLLTPEPQGTEILLEVTHCGVCHSDLHLWEGYYDLGSAGKFDMAARGISL